MVDLPDVWMRLWHGCAAERRSGRAFLYERAVVLTLLSLLRGIWGLASQSASHPYSMRICRVCVV